MTVEALIASTEMNTNTHITEHVIKCFLIISFLIIYTNKLIGTAKGKIYKSDYQILSISCAETMLSFGSKIAFKGVKLRFQANQKK